MARRPSSVRLSVCLSVNFCANRFFSHTNGRIATKLSQDWLQVSMHPGCAQGQGQGQRSRDTRTFLHSWNELLRHWRSGLSFHAFCHRVIKRVQNEWMLNLLRENWGNKAWLQLPQRAGLPTAAYLGKGGGIAPALSTPTPLEMEQKFLYLFCFSFVSIYHFWWIKIFKYVMWIICWILNTFENVHRSDVPIPVIFLYFFVEKTTFRRILARLFLKSSYANGGGSNPIRGTPGVTLVKLSTTLRTTTR